MRSNLFTGLDTAKGLAVAWKRPLIGVHHMQAHALTPRLVRALQNSSHLDTRSNECSSGTSVLSKIQIEPDFPFLSVLASGGHTLLINSASLTDHKVMASTTDIAVGECLDKIARAVLPAEILQMSSSTMYGPLLEEFAFPMVNITKDSVGPKIEEQPVPEFKHGHFQSAQAESRLENITAREYLSIYASQYELEVPKSDEEALKYSRTKWGWSFNQPLSKGAGGLKSKTMEMSFTGLLTAVERAVQLETNKLTGKITKNSRSAEHVSLEERRDMARESMRAAFAHLASRVVLSLQQLSMDTPTATVTTIVVAGGVAANSYLKFMYASSLSQRDILTSRVQTRTHTLYKRIFLHAIRISTS